MFLAKIFPQWPPVVFSLSSPFTSAEPAERRNSASTRILGHRGLKQETSALSVESAAWPEQLHSQPPWHEAGSLAWKTSFQLPGSFTAEPFSKQIASGHTSGPFLLLAMQKWRMWETTELSSCLPLLQGSPLPHTKHLFFPWEAGKGRITKYPLLVSAKNLQKMQQSTSYGLCSGSPGSQYVFSASWDRKNRRPWPLFSDTGFCIRPIWKWAIAHLIALLLGYKDRQKSCSTSMSLLWYVVHWSRCLLALSVM